MAEGKIEKALRGGKDFDAKRIEIECLDDDTYTIRVWPKEEKKSKPTFEDKSCTFSAPNEEDTLKIVKKYL